VSAKVIYSKRNKMTELFESKRDFPYIRWAEGFFIGAIVVTLVALLTPQPVTAVDRVNVVQVVEKPVVVKEPVYLSAHDKRQIQCLAENAYFEAGNQSTRGKIAVTNVVMNRVEDKRFPKTPCSVINQRTARVCQFSWVCEGKKRIRSMAQYTDALKVAEQVYLGKIGDVTNGAKFYHANYVNPRWNLRRVITIGDHIFYR
jgi:spore germination cell wall hydrolase CwlJ-like protein